jgi:hypothetical protein
VVGERHLETLPAGQFEFWFSPSLRPANQRLNAQATKILLGTSYFTAQRLPLLRGRVVVTGRCPDGALRSLNDDEIVRMSDFVFDLPCFDDWVLDWRLSRTARQDRRRAQPHTANRISRCH